MEEEPARLGRQLELPDAAGSCWLVQITAYIDGADPAEALTIFVRERELARLALERDGRFIPRAFAARIDAILGRGSLFDGFGLLAPLRAVK